MTSVDTAPVFTVQHIDGEPEVFHRDKYMTREVAQATLPYFERDPNMTEEAAQLRLALSIVEGGMR